MKNRVELLSVEKSIEYLFQNGFKISRKTFQKFLDSEEIKAVDISVKGAERRRLKIPLKELEKFLISLTK